ncbi:CPBP family intramembrane glutamic endopeptidase [Cohnella fermenti]|uniref:CPBP family intramembrane metalloprotease n=1 Tax=Cohnella fermenti TaxID=2565925 RepID=A0A4S4BPU8_9BACL|nr:CPBP family intramembrane glutamic endopeptidase [Cohnella fermenti]THF76932.1 CPBP family intramembrane metalloprotease [Cohnella fermenti]
MFSRRWVVVSIIGLLAFLWIQVGPGIRTMLTEESTGVLSRDDAQAAAFGLAESRWGIERGQVAATQLTHRSDNDAIAYLSREKLLGDYEEQWDASYPTDVYRADLQLADGRWLRLELHMLTGKLVGWAWFGEAGGAASDPTASNSPVYDDAQSASTSASPASDSPSASDVKAFLKTWGYEPAEWEATGGVTENGDFVYQSRKAPLGEARLQLLVKPNESISYRLLLPDSFTAYLDKQEERATKWSLTGYLLPMIVLFVLSIAYAIRYRRWTSLRRGWLLSLAYFGLYAAFTWNMIAGFRSQSDGQGAPSTDGSVEALIILNVFILAATAILTSFSASGGDGLWRSMGFKLWPSWRDADFGGQVLRSMKTGYGLGLIILGAQSVIFLGLDGWLGSFTGSDASQSTYNMTYPWLLPSLAWCAGISEELIYRFFAFALFRRWLIGLARLVTGREPGRLAAGALTFAAMLPPSLFWAFGHVGYPIYPVQSRVIELMIIGVLIGWFLLRFGLMAVIFAHVTLDAILMSVQLIFDGLPYDPVSGLISMTMPALVGLALWKLHGRFSKSRPGVE